MSTSGAKVGESAPLEAGGLRLREDIVLYAVQ